MKYYIITSGYMARIGLVIKGKPNGFITISNHNVHNGWYGGFCIRSEYK